MTPLPSSTALSAQLPRLSQYDPGVIGEGGLDPMGLAAVADRIAELLAPGVRARMSQPRFVTLTALGAVACQELNGLVAEDGSTTADIAFEWLTVEALVRNGKADELIGLPGRQKAQRAGAMRERLNAKNYLRGARVFGFTGVYRPFSQHARVIDIDGLPGAAAERLVEAWERDKGASGFVAVKPGTHGAWFRRDIAAATRKSLQQGECSAPPTGTLMLRLAATMTPRGAGARERRELRALVIGDADSVRHVVTSSLLTDPPAAGTPEHEIAQSLYGRATGHIRQVLRAAIDYEECATLVNNTFRRLLIHSGAQANGVLTRAEAAAMPYLAAASKELPDRTRRAVDSAARVDEALAQQVSAVLDDFDQRMVPDALFATLLSRHDQVQAAKGKRAWLDEIAGGWFVRPAYREQQVAQDDTIWTHPMRLLTLTQFLRETA